MVGLDSSTPPVVFVVGTAGAGKSSLVTAFSVGQGFSKQMQLL